ncbi:SIS domain-containing protein [Lachnotalea glycerini]|uniref:SIS domain-containing protein n=1 Tax=Lachnotalea glycerini TaxID=1763509 RepID=UPI003A7F4B0D
MIIKFDEQKQIDSVNGALALRKEIEKIVDKIYDEGFDGIYWIGIGGTYASSLQAEVYMRGKTKLPVFVENAAQFITTGNLRFTEKSVMIISSVTGSTKEMIQAVAKAREIGARVFGFIDKAKTELAKMCNYCISYPVNEQLKFFMTANRFMYRNHEFPEYDLYNQEMEAHLAQALVDVEKAADDFGKEFAKKHCEDSIHYFVGAGVQWGSTYSYAMCYWEEQHWLRTKSITAEEFFHGMLEIVDKNTAVTVFLGEDEQRPLAERVAAFLPKICGNYTLIDAKDYAQYLQGISTKFRGSISHLITHAVTQRIDAHMEIINRHPVDIRRYYRQLDY